MVLRALVFFLLYSRSLLYVFISRASLITLQCASSLFNCNQSFRYIHIRQQHTHTHTHLDSLTSIRRGSLGVCWMNFVFFLTLLRFIPDVIRIIGPLFTHALRIGDANVCDAHHCIKLIQYRQTLEIPNKPLPAMVLCVSRFGTLRF